MLKAHLVLNILNTKDIQVNTFLDKLFIIWSETRSERRLTPRKRFHVRTICFSATGFCEDSSKFWFKFSHADKYC